MTTLWVDTRYDGKHGIGRYATEVIARLDLPWRPLPLGGNPTSPKSLFARAAGMPASTDLVYSPGYAPIRSRARQVLTLHDLIHLEGSRSIETLSHVAYYNGLVRQVVNRAGVVLTVSRTSQFAIQRWLKRPGVDVVDAGNACSASFKLHGPTFEASRPYALFVGGAKPHKNAELAIRSLALLPDLDLIAVTHDSEALHNLARASRLEQRFRTVSDVDDDELAKYYRGASVLLFPSIVEGFGLPPLEARNCGTPTAYYIGCAAVHEVVDREEHSVSDPTDVAGYARAITKAIGDGAPAHREVGDWQQVADHVSATLQRELSKQ